MKSNFSGNKLKIPSMIPQHPKRRKKDVGKNNFSTIKLQSAFITLWIRILLILSASNVSAMREDFVFLSVNVLSTVS